MMRLPTARRVWKGREGYWVAITICFLCGCFMITIMKATNPEVVPWCQFDQVCMLCPQRVAVFSNLMPFSWLSQHTHTKHRAHDSSQGVSQGVRHCCRLACVQICSNVWLAVFGRQVSVTDIYHTIPVAASFALVTALIQVVIALIQVCTWFRETQGARLKSRCESLA